MRFLLTGKDFSEKGKYDPSDHSAYPDDCMIDFDMRLIDLFDEIDKKNLKVKERIRREYFRIKEFLGKVPSRMELFTYMEDEVYRVALSHAKDDPFKRYLGFLSELGELTDEEEALCRGIGKEFIGLLENTNMSKVYKMPVLLAFYNHGEVRMEVTEGQLLENWKGFFSEGTNWKDLEKDISYDRYLTISDKEHLKKILKMPVHFLLESGKGFFVQKDGAVLALREELGVVVGNSVFAGHMGDVIEYRIMDYYQRRYRTRYWRNEGRQGLD